MMLSALMICALLISKDVLTEENALIIPAAGMLSGFAACKLAGNGRGEGALTGTLLTAVFVFLLLTLLAPAVKSTQYGFRSAALYAAVYAAGDLLGNMARVNKKYKRKHHQRPKYNN